MYEWNFLPFWEHRDLILHGAWITIVFTVVTTITGMLFGIIVGMARASQNRLISGISRCIIEPFRCTPVLVQLLWFNYAFPVLFGIELSVTAASILTLTFYGGSFYAEIVRGGIISIDVGQKEAGQALGMKKWQVMKRIVLPQAMRRMVPPLVNQSILQLKNTSLIGIIAVPELLHVTQNIINDRFLFLEGYTAVAIVYFIIIFPLTFWAERLELKTKQS